MILRQEIFTRVVNQLRRIRTGNTYAMYGQPPAHYLTNIGQNVFIWRATQFQPNELPGLIVRDLDEPVELSSKDSVRVKRSLHMQIEVVLAGDTPIVDMWAVYADIDAAIGEGRESVWADISTGTRPRITRSVVEQESAKIAGGIYEFFIDYPTLAFQSIVSA